MSEGGGKADEWGGRGKGEDVSGNTNAVSRLNDIEPDEWGGEGEKGRGRAIQATLVL